MKLNNKSLDILRKKVVSYIQTIIIYMKDVFFLDVECDNIRDDNKIRNELKLW